MRSQYICSRIKDLTHDLRDAKAFEDEEAFQHDLRGLRKMIKALSESVKEEREDGVFFEGELEDKKEIKPTIGAHVKEEKEDSCDEEHEDACDPVEAFRKRRQERMDKKKACC